MKAKILKKDIIIPAGSIFTPAAKVTQRFTDEHFEYTIGLNNDTFGTLTYCIEPGLDDWFQDWHVDTKQRLKLYIEKIWSHRERSVTQDYDTSDENIAYLFDSLKELAEIIISEGNAPAKGINDKYPTIQDALNFLEHSKKQLLLLTEFYYHPAIGTTLGDVRCAIGILEKIYDTNGTEGYSQEGRCMRSGKRHKKEDKKNEGKL